MLLRKHVLTLQDIYRKVARIDSGLSGYMNISEFEHLVTALGLVDEKKMQAKDVGSCFNMAMMT